MKLKRFGKPRNCQQSEQTAYRLAKNSVSYTSERVLLPRIYKELQKLNTHTYVCNQSIYNLMNQILIFKKKKIDNKYFFMCFNITKQQRNANQSYTESPSLPSQYGYHWKSKIYQTWSRVWENKLNSLLVQGTLTQILWKLVLNFLKKKI